LRSRRVSGATPPAQVDLPSTFLQRGAKAPHPLVRGFRFGPDAGPEPRCQNKQPTATEVAVG